MSLPATDSLQPRILVLAYRFPPQGGIAVQRPAKMVATWSREGASIEVLSGPVGFVDLEDPALLRGLPPGLTPRRVRDPSPWVHLLRARRRFSTGTGTRVLGRGAGLLGELVRRLSVPDGMNGWLATALWTAKRVARSFRPNVVFVTGPPFTPFVAGALIARMLRIPLVLDYRDPWTATYLPHADDPWLASRVNPALEKRVLRQAAGVIAAHRAILSHLRPVLPEDPGRRPRILWVPNGYDRGDFDECVRPNRERFTLCYTGSFFRARRNPQPLIDTLENLLQERRIDPARFRFRFAGEVERLRPLCAPGGRLLEALQLKGYVPHAESVRYLRESTVNLVMEGDMGGPNLTTPAKTYEALFAGRPILLLCPEGTTTRLARRAGGAWIAHPEDREAIREALLDLYSRWSSGLELNTPEREKIRFYDRELQARRTLGFIRDLLPATCPGS